MLPCFPNFSSLSHTFPIMKFILSIIFIMKHLEFKFYIGRGWCVFFIWHDSTCKNWLVVKKILKLLVFHSNTLNILTCSHLLRFLWNWNQHQIEGQNKLKKKEREREKRKERECGAVGATSTPSTVGLFSFLTMLFLPTFSQHWPNGFVIQTTR